MKFSFSSEYLNSTNFSGSWKFLSRKPQAGGKWDANEQSEN